MSETLALASKPASIEDLTPYVNKVFVKERHGTKSYCILKEVGDRNVIVGYQDRVDTCKLSRAEFLKFWRSVK